jgi:hypothetical protein
VAVVEEVHRTTEQGFSMHSGSSEMGTQAQVAQSPSRAPATIVGVVVAIQKRPSQGLAGQTGFLAIRHWEKTITINS